jgi:hypothetical protein
VIIKSIGTDTTIRPSVLVAPPLGMSTALADRAGHAIKHLPEELLRAMVRGLRAHADDLAPGVLFRNHSSGGCAVGITLRELAPEAFDFGRVRFWLWQRWRRGVERDVGRRFPRLKHLQWHFDEAVTELEKAGYPQPAKAVGLWLAASAEAELRSRRGVDAETSRLPTRTAHLARGPARARAREAETTRTRPEPEAY